MVARVAKLLLDLSQDGRQPIDRGQHTIQEMSEMVATTPEAISRSLNVIKNSGAISVNRGKIMVISIEKLATLAQVEPIYSE